MDGTHPRQLHYLSSTHCAAPVTFGSELLLLAVGLLRVLPTVCCVCEGNEINTKIRVADGGFAFAWMVVPTVGKRVFLRAVSTIPTVMRCMTPSTATVQKAAFGRSKSPAFAGTKTAANRRPSPNPPKAPPHALPKGRESIPAEFKDVWMQLLPLGEGWDGASMLGWGFYVGWYAPLATLSELLLLAGGHYVFSPLFTAPARMMK